MKEDKSKNIIIILLLIIIIILSTALVLVYTNNDTKTNYSDDTNKVQTTLTEEEAITIGKQLYDKATEAYEVWALRPYCSTTFHKSLDKETIELEDAAVGKGTYYYSGFSTLDDLKNELKTYLSEEIINSKITKEAVTDVSLLKDIAYNDYVEQNGKLYCRNFSGKGWMSRYLNNYEITISSIEENKIIYNIKSTYVTEEAQINGSKCWNSPELNINNCNNDELEYQDTKFTIEKINNNWIVTDYTLHY